jgi:hypothetical protein
MQNGQRKEIWPRNGRMSFFSSKGRSPWMLGTLVYDVRFSSALKAISFERWYMAHGARGVWAVASEAYIWTSQRHVLPQRTRLLEGETNAELFLPAH